MANVAQQKWTICIGEHGPIRVRERGQASYGELVRYTRKIHHISIEDVAMLYGKIVDGDPVTQRHIRRMEHNDSFFLNDHNRRWVLARLLRMPPELMAYLSLEVVIPDGRETAPERPLFPISTRTVDTTEYYKTLHKYWVEGYPRGVENAILDVRRRISLLKDKALSEFSLAKPVMTRLLCGYKILLADIAIDQQFYTEAEHYLTEAFDIAGARQCPDLQAMALMRRMTVHRTSGDFATALSDFARAQQLEALSNFAKKTVPKNKPGHVEIPQQLKRPVASAAQIWGWMVSIASVSEAHLAQNEGHRVAALKRLDDTERLPQPISTEDFQFFVTFDKERYFLSSAEACMESPLKKLRSPTKAAEYLKEAQKESVSKGRSINGHRQALNDIVQAKIYCDREGYLVAATTAEQALLTLNRLESKFALDRIARVLAEIKEHDSLAIEVMSLEAELMKAQQPYLFR
jgi:hypothetical protein